MAKLKDYKAPKPKSYEEFLWWCAGADKEILKECTYADYVKYSGLGGIVLATGILAWLSMTFALNRVFETNLVAVPLGLVWGAIIFNLDRFVVSSTGKGDGKHTISWGEIYHAIPRIIMAGLIGLTISAPLEIYIFQKEIDKQWEIRKDQEMRTAKDEVTLQHRKDVYDQLQAKENELLGDITKFKEQINRLTEMIADETTRVRCGPICQGHKQQRIELQEQMDTKEHELTTLRDSIKLIDLEREEIVKKRIHDKYDGKVGLLDSLVTLHAYPGSKMPTLLLMLLFVFIEIAPVLFKLMIAYSPYDYLSENLMQIQLAKQGIEFKEGFSKVEDGSFHDKITFHEARQLVEEEAIRRKSDMDLYRQLMEEYTAREAKNMGEHPDQYIKPL